MECFKCEIPDSKARLFDAISSKGIVKICEKCSREEKIPFINKPKEPKFNEYKEKAKEPKQIKRSVIYERLSRMSGVKVGDGRESKSEEFIEKEDELKKLANKNFEAKLPEKKSYPHLANNFHWIIMRARRAKKLTAEQLARDIVEPEAAIKMAERGVLPENEKILVGKIERRLEIRLVKEEFREIENPAGVLVQKTDFGFGNKNEQEKIDFKSDEIKTLTIADLQEAKREKEAGIFEKPEKEFKEGIYFNEETKEEPEFMINDSKPNFKKEEEKELTEKEIDGILFGRK